MVVGLAEQDNGELGQRIGLHQGQRFEEFIHRPKSPGHDDEGVGVFHHHHLPHEAMLEGNGGLHIGIGLLLDKELDIAADGMAPQLKSAAISRPHDPRPPARQRAEARSSDALSEFPGRLVLRMIFPEARRTEYRYAGPDKMKGPEALDELAENPPGKAELIAPALRPFQVDGLFGRYDL